uniref:Amino acid transporter transmembrane domain-containing protein n=1 Tax=Acrobeloides nanus TaxID=290746 RepID=A0A914CIU1_9BILA
MPEFQITNYFSALGTILFSFSGHTIFPTIQHDMKKPYQFTRSTSMAYIIMLSMYLPATIIASLTYGDSLRESILNSIQTYWIRSTITIFVTINVAFTMIIIFNPLNQEFEEIFNAPHEFGFKRVLLRAGVLLCTLFFAETIPTFGPLLNLIGASTFNLITLPLPAIFYLYLHAREIKTEKNLCDMDEMPSLSDIIKYNSRHTLILCFIVIILGIIGGICGTFSAILSLISTQFSVPCYIRPFMQTDVATLLNNW